MSRNIHRPQIVRSRSGHSYRTAKAQGRVESNVSVENDYGQLKRTLKKRLLIKVT